MYVQHDPNFGRTRLKLLYKEKNLDGSTSPTKFGPIFFGPIKQQSNLTLILDEST